MAHSSYKKYIIEILSTDFVIMWIFFILGMFDLYFIFYLPYNSYWIYYYPYIQNPTSKLFTIFIFYIFYHLLFLLQSICIYFWIKSFTLKNYNENILSFSFLCIWIYVSTLPIFSTYNIFMITYSLSFILSSLIFISFFILFVLIRYILIDFIYNEYKKFKIECQKSYEKHVIIRNV